MLRSRGALQTSAKPRSCCWDRGLPAGGSSFYKNKAGLIQNPGNLSRLLAYASAALYRELQGKDWDRGCRSLQGKTASSHGLFANASMLSCWPFLGLVLAVSPSRAHTFIPHEPPAPNPSSEVHLVQAAPVTTVQTVPTRSLFPKILMFHHSSAQRLFPARVMPGPFHIQPHGELWEYVCR